MTTWEKYGFRRLVKHYGCVSLLKGNTVGEIHHMYEVCAAESSSSILAYVYSWLSVVWWDFSQSQLAFAGMVGVFTVPRLASYFAFF